MLSSNIQFNASLNQVRTFTTVFVNPMGKVWQVSSRYFVQFSTFVSSNIRYVAQSTSPYFLYTMGGVVLLGVSLYALYRRLLTEKKDPKQTLLHAMSEFRNFNAALAKKYTAPKTLLSYLEACHEAYPSAHSNKDKIRHMVEIQRTLESVKGDINKLIEDYKIWLKSQQNDPYQYFSITEKEGQKEYVLIQLTKGSSVSPENLTKRFVALQNYYAKGIPLDQSNCPTKKEESAFSSAFGPPPKFFGVKRQFGEIGEVAIAQEKKNSLTHSFHSALKKGNEASHKISKKIYQVNLLKKTLAENPDWKNDADFRTWVTSSLLYLKKECDNIPLAGPLQKDWQEAVQYLEIVENELLALPNLNPIALPYKQDAVPFSLKSINFSNLVPYPGVNAINCAVPTSTTITEPEAALTLPPQLNLKDDFDLIKQWHGHLITSYKQGGKISLLDTEVAQLLLSLPSTKAATSTLKDLSKEEKTELATLMDELGRLSLTLQLASEKIVPHPSRFLGVLKAVDLLLSIAQDIDNPAMSNLTLDFNIFENVVADPYFDMGPYQSDITKTLESMKKRLASANSLAVHEMNFNSEPKGNLFVQSTFLQTQSSPIVHQLYSLALLAQGLSWPHKCMQHKKLKPDFNRANIKDIIFSFYKVALKTLSPLMLEDRELIHLSENGIVILAQGKGLGLQYNHVADYEIQKAALWEYGVPLSPYYYAANVSMEPEIRNRLAEGMVSTRSSGITNQDGGFKNDFSINRIPQGLKQTEYHINLEKHCFPFASIETSRDLQKMASGRTNRASNALYTFAQHPHLLLQKDYGKDYIRILRLHLFREDFLLRQWKASPATFHQELQKFDLFLSSAEKSMAIEEWALLYQAHADLIANLKAAGIDASERILKHEAYTLSLLEKIKASPRKTSLHTAYLYAKATLGFSIGDHLEMGKSLLFIKPSLTKFYEDHPFEGQVLVDLIPKMTSLLIDKVEKEGLEILDQLISYRIPQNGRKNHWKEVSKGVYQAAALYINLQDLDIIQSGKQEGSLPKEIQEDDQLKALFGSLLKQVYTFTFVSTPLGKAWHVTIEKGGTTYSLYLNPQKAGFPLLYRQKKGQGWEQQMTLHTTEKLPLDIKKGFVWCQDGRILIEDSLGQPLYFPQLKGTQLVKLERMVNGTKQLVLHTNNDRLFSQLDGPEGFVVTKQSNTTFVTYLRGALQYAWDAKERLWKSTTYKDYFLSNTPINKWIPKGKQSGNNREHFFHSSFAHYHLLENGKGKAKLIIPRKEYQRPNALEKKYSSALEPIENDMSPWSKQAFAVYELEKNGYPFSKQPQDLLYMSYLLFIQGKYGRALLFMQQSRAIWTSTDPSICAQRDEVRKWIMKWDDRSPNGKAFKTKMLLMEHSLKESTFTSRGETLLNDKTLLPSLLDMTHNYLLNEKQTDSLLRLTKHELEDIKFLVPRCPSWVQGLLESNKKSALIDNDVINYYKERYSTVEEALQWSLDRQIEALEKMEIKQKKAKTLPTSYVTKPVFDISVWLKPIREQDSHLRAKLQITDLVNELKQLFQGDSSLANTIGLTLADDMLYHTEKVEESFTIDEKASLSELEQKLFELESSYLKDEKKLRQKIGQLFIPKHLDRSQTIERQLKEQEAYYDDLFEKARHCFGLNDYSILIDMKVLSKRQEIALNDALLAYEITRTDRKLLLRKLEKVQELKNDPSNSILRDDCAKILQEWSQYDREKHPYAPLLLLLEDELNLTARPSQIEHIHKLTLNPNAYIHEAMAGGKTTFLRNLFSAIENKNGRLAGVMTYAPLMAMHHKEYERVNQLTFGSTAVPILYHRNAPNDATALKLMLIYHLRALKRMGRIDQTPQASISLNHTLTELVSKLNKSDPQQLQELAPMVNTLQKLLRLRSEDLSVYSDEIDKIFDPLKDFNYAVERSKVGLQAKYYQPALAIIKLLMTHSSLASFATAIKQNGLSQLSDDTFNAYLRSLAQACIEHFKLPFDKSIMIDYLTETHQKDPSKQKEMIAFYQEQILNHSDQDTVLTIQMLHSLIGVLMRNMKTKKVGTDFCRSKDGISVKPCSFSAVCQESSQRSFVLSTVLETCLDYFVDGVSSEGARAYVEKMKEFASKELLTASHLDTTSTGIKFKQTFGVNLTEIEDKDYKAIALKLNSSFDLFKECLEEILLKNFTYYEEKMEGSAHQLSYLVGHFAGSSGSPERVNTLPNSIKKKSELIRQPGAIGSVFYAFLKGFEKMDMIQVDSVKNIPEQLAKHLKRGDTLVDNAPFFSGMKGIAIIEAIAKAMPNLSKFRFLDDADDVCIYANGQVEKGEKNCNLKDTLTIIQHKGKQGTNLTFAMNTNGYVEADVLTELTTFYQSLMRFRLLGKGQKAKVLFDQALTKLWDNTPCLQGKSLLAKLIWTLVQNEASLLQRLHYQANRKQICLIRTRALDQIKHNVNDIKALADIKGLSMFKMSDKTVLDPQKCGMPVLLGSPSVSLKEMIGSERNALNVLKEEISTLALSDSIRQQCDTIIQQAVNDLNPNLIMDDSLLPASVQSPYDETNSHHTEEIEIEAVGEQETEQEVSLEVATEVSLSMEQAQNIEKKESCSPHPREEEGGQDEFTKMETEYIQHYWNYGQIPIAASRFSSTPKTYYVEQPLFPSIKTTRYALGVCDYMGVRGLYKNFKHTGVRLYDIRTDPQNHLPNLLWLYGNPLWQATIGPKALIKIDAQKKISCELASVKETDIRHQYIMNSLSVADAWKDVTWEEAIEMDPSELCLEQWDYAHHVNNDQHAQHKVFTPATYDGQTKFYKALKGYFTGIQLFKVDLRETSIPDTVPQELREQWIQTMALAKLQYIEASFSPEEEAYLKKWLKDHNADFPATELEKRLKDYLSRFYPNARNLQLLKIIQSVKDVSLSDL